MLKNSRRTQILACSILSFVSVCVGSPQLAIADEGPGCNLSGYHAVAGDFVPVNSTHASISYGGSSRGTDPNDANFHIVNQVSNVTNSSTSHSYFESRWVIGHVLLQPGSANPNYVTTYNGSGTFISNLPPSPAGWQPRANTYMTFTPQGNNVRNLTTQIYGQVSGVPATGTLSGVSVSVDPAEAVPAYDLGTISPNSTVAAKTTAKVDRPTNTSGYGWTTADLIAVRTCLPDPTFTSTTLSSGSQALSGTGDYVGDQITILDGSGNTLATTTVLNDLTWSTPTTSALANALHQLTVKETDEFGLFASSTQAIQVGPVASPPAPSIELASTGNEGIITNLTFAVGGICAGLLLVTRRKTRK